MEPNFKKTQKISILHWALEKTGRLKMSKGGINKRKSPRVPLSVKVTNLSSGNFSYYHAANISAGGMFLKAHEPKAMGTRLKLKFNLPNYNSDIITESVVVWTKSGGTDRSNPKGMGIEFVEISKESKNAILEFVNIKM
jgi:uncharacterized protein (TIGR02266 family)